MKTDEKQQKLAKSVVGGRTRNLAWGPHARWHDLAMVARAPDAMWHDRAIPHFSLSKSTFSQFCWGMARWGRATLARCGRADWHNGAVPPGTVWPCGLARSGRVDWHGRAPGSCSFLFKVRSRVFTMDRSGVTWGLVWASLWKFLG